MKSNLKKITFSATISAIYFLLCFVEQEFASGAIQCRLAEALCLLPLFLPESILGITIGCFLFNLTSGVIYDIIFGTLITFIACIMTFLIGKIIKIDFLRIILGSLPHILLNGFLIPLILIYGLSSNESYWFLFLTISIGETIAVLIFGSILYYPLKKIIKNYNL